MKILLVDPPGKNKGLNTGLGYLSALLKEKHEIRVLDLNNVEIGFCGDPNPDMPAVEMEKKIASTIDDFKPEIIGISVKTFTAEVSKHIFEFLNATRPNLITVAGGPHITLDGSSYIEENRIDYGIQGEGEYVTLDLFDALERNKGIENIEGVFFWKDNRLVHNPKNGGIKDLDAIPFPYYENFSSVVDNGGHLEEYPLLTSRGCPYKCSYCSMPKIMGGKWRSHTPERVIEELHHAKKKYHCTSFTVVDDNLTLNLKRIEDICDLLISEKINLSWNSQNGIRADRIDENLAEKMKRSGCQYVWVGIESADERVFKSVNKGETLKDIKRGIRNLKDAGIQVGGFFITGLPYSTREADLKSIEFVKRNRIDGWWFNFVPYPHTQAWEWIQNFGKVLRPSQGALQFGTENLEPLFETDEYSRESRIKTYNEIHIRLKHFDRLVDPSLRQWEKWRRVFAIVLPFGIANIFSLLLFIVRYNFKSMKKKLRSSFGV